jgi:hypothetical protein
MLTAVNLVMHAVAYHCFGSNKGCRRAPRRRAPLLGPGQVHFGAARLALHHGKYSAPTRRCFGLPAGPSCRLHLISLRLACCCCLFAEQCHLELPHVNVLSKVDLVQQFGQLGALCDSVRGRFVYVLLGHAVVCACLASRWLITRLLLALALWCSAFGLDFYTDVLDLDYLLEHLQQVSCVRRSIAESPFCLPGRVRCAVPQAQHGDLLGRARLPARLVRRAVRPGEIAFVRYSSSDPCAGDVGARVCLQDKHSMYKVLRVIDKANGYIYGDMDQVPDKSVFSSVAASEEDASDWDR